jgi:hypothetical protein
MQNKTMNNFLSTLARMKQRTGRALGHLRESRADSATEQSELAQAANRLSGNQTSRSSARTRSQRKISEDRASIPTCDKRKTSGGEDPTTGAQKAGATLCLVGLKLSPAADGKPAETAPKQTLVETGARAGDEKRKLTQETAGGELLFAGRNHKRK